MDNVINISVYNLSDVLSTKYTKIGIFTSADGVSFSEITSSGTRISLAVETEYYQYIHTASGIFDNLYNYKFFKQTGSSSSFITTDFYANTSDLTEDLRYAIEDITDEKRYTIKELRRFIKMACNNLQSSLYKNRFKADYNGIISPRFTNEDKAIILQQALIEINKSQLLRSADTNISYNDGRGSINIKTHDALKLNIKMLIDERDSMIKMNNRILTLPLRVEF